MAIGRQRINRQPGPDGDQGVHQHHSQHGTLKASVRGCIGTEQGPHAHSEPKSEKRVKQRRPQTVQGHVGGAEIQHEVRRTAEIPTPGGQTAERQQNQHHRRCHHPYCTLDTVHHALHRHPHHQQQEESVPAHEHAIVPRVRHQRGEDTCGFSLAGANKPAHGSVEYVGQSDGTENSRKGKHQKSRQHPQTTSPHPRPGPSRAANETIHRQHQSMAGVSSHRGFGDHQRQRDQQQARQVQQYEQPAAMLAGQVGELPHVRETKGCPGRGPEKSGWPGPRPDWCFVWSRHSIP